MKKRVVIIGGGFGGVAAANKLDPNTTEVTLIDRRNHYLFQPLLYQVATGSLAGESIAHPLRQMLSARKHVTTVLDEVQAIDLSARKVQGKATNYDYDYLILAAGAKTGYFGNNHWAQHTVGMKTLEEAYEIRERVLLNLEKAEIEPDAEKRKHLMRVVIVGGGPTGVELAGSFAELGRTVMRNNFRRINPAELHVILIEALPRLLPPFPETLSASCLKQIKELGVDVRLNTKVKDIREGTVVLENEEISTPLIIWAAGVEANSLSRSLGVPVDRGGRIEVKPDCSIPGFENAFAIGDMISLVDTNKVRVPGVSPAAIQTGEYVAHLINQEARTGVPVPTSDRVGFSYWDKGSMAIIGNNRAVAKVGNLQMTGWLAWKMWLAVHVLFLEGWRNRYVAVCDWVYNYLFNQRSARIFPERLKNPQP